MSANEIFNPLDKKHLGESVADALLRNSLSALGAIEEFFGAGIYAIYYSGTFPPYALLSKQDPELPHSTPIYVGKAIPPGARKGRFGLGGNPGKSLFNRLREHAQSIRDVTNLNIEDFRCRYLVVDDIWIPLGESLLIAKFSPLWNKVIDGFGNHDPGSGRYEQERSRWDVLHPGRAWSQKCKVRKESAEIIVSELENYLQNQQG